MLRSRKVIHLIKNLNYDLDFFHLFTSLEICNSGYYEHVDLSDNSNKSQVEKKVKKYIMLKVRKNANCDSQRIIRKMVRNTAVVF